MAYGVVYKISNTINDKIYIGQTTRTIEQRFKEHMDSPYPIGKAMRKYGIDKFTIVVIEECETQEQLNEREIANIAEYDCMAPKGYNLTTGGESGSRCAESRDRNSAAQKKRFEDPAEHEKISLAVLAYNEVHPEIHDKISEAGKRRYEDPAEHEKAAERTRKSFEDPERMARHIEGQKRRFERQEEHDKIAAAVTKRFSDPAERDAQSVRIQEAFKKPGVIEAISKRQKERFEDPEEHKKVAIGVLKFFAENGGRAHTDESKDKIRVKRLAYFARLRLKKVAGENQAAADWNVSAQDLKAFHAENPDAIKPHSTDDRKAQTEIKLAAKRLAAVAEQNKMAAKLKNLPALGKYHAEHFDATKKISAVAKKRTYSEEAIARNKVANKKYQAKKRVERLPRMIAKENQLAAARLPEMFKLEIYLAQALQLAQ